MNPLYALEGLNFFMADVQAGIGPFLGVFLQAQGWHPESIGTVMTLGGIAGMLTTSPAGALVDATHHKRRLIVAAGVMTTLASLALWVSHDFWMVAASQVLTAVTGAALGPAVAGVTLGIVRERGFDRQFARNQMANHAGNVVGAALFGLARLALRIRCGVRARGRIRCDDGPLDAAHQPGFDRSRQRARPRRLVVFVVFFGA